jgi:hypothetical protein
VSVEDSCTVSTKHIIGSKIIFGASDGTPRLRGSTGTSFCPVFTHPMELLGDVGHLESRFGQFGDGVSVDVRLMHGLC